MIEDKTPMLLGLPGHILLNKNLNHSDILSYALIVALEPLREEWDISIHDVAEILDYPLDKLKISIKKLIKESYLVPTECGLVGYWS